LDILIAKIPQNHLIKYNDFELNTMKFKQALIHDKRTYSKYYISLIEKKHPLLFIFFTMNDYNSIIIKVDLFFLSFSIYYFVNALFFNENIIHKIYEDGGIYNFIYLIPFVSYSFLISHIVYIIIKYFSLSERNIYQIKVVNGADNTDKIKGTIICKYILFFILSIALLSFFWYYLSSFGAVYQNTQTHLIKNTIISFSFSLIYPFIINILPVIIRINSLRKKDMCMYKISMFIQYI
jgi:hypothetical protein